MDFTVADEVKKVCGHVPILGVKTWRSLGLPVDSDP
jgi:hypothetical protein